MITGSITSFIPYGGISCITVQGQSKKEQILWRIQVHYSLDLIIHKRNVEKYVIATGRIPNYAECLSTSGKEKIQLRSINIQQATPLITHCDVILHFGGFKRHDSLKIISKDYASKKSITVYRQ